MLALFPILSYLLLVPAIGSRRTEPSFGKGGLREALLLAAVVWCVWLVIGTEILSSMVMLRQVPIAIWWGIPVVAGTLDNWLRRKQIVAWLGGIRRSSFAREPWTRTLIGCCLLLIFVASICAFLSPPNTGDAIGYHIPRQIHWLQNSAVTHYLTPDLRELMMPPLTEYAGVHLMALSGSDLFANAAQWIAYILVALVTSLIVRDLGGSRQVQSLASFLLLANPMAYLQASSAKNDLVLSLWICLLAWSAIWIVLRKNCDLRHAIWIGMVLGLSLLTKGTALAFAPAICAVIGISTILYAPKRSVLLGLTMILLALAINAGHMYRNQQTFGFPTGPRNAAEGGYDLTNEVHSPTVLMSNIVRNLALHATFFGKDGSTRIVDSIRQLHSVTGVDSDDPRTTKYGDFELAPSALIIEDKAPAPVQVGLVLLALIVVIVRPRTLNGIPHWIILFMAVAAFVLFCFLLKWQQWHTRLHLPAVCLAIPFVATALSCLRLKWALPFLIAISLWPVTVTALWNRARPLLTERSVVLNPRSSRLMTRSPVVYQSIKPLIEQLRIMNPRSIGLVVANPEEYVVMRAIRTGLEPDPTFQSMFGRFPKDWRDAPPDLIVVRKDRWPHRMHRTSGIVYSLVWENELYGICLPVDQ